MSKRIQHLEQSPCYQCDSSSECEEKIRRNNHLQEVQDYVFGRRWYDYKLCPIWIALNAPEMIEVDE